MRTNILFEQNAVRRLLGELKKSGYTWDHIEYINQNRYCIIKGNPCIAILLKTEPFFNFGLKFQRNGEKGVGDSINVIHLKQFIQAGVQFVYTMFKDGKVYKISIEKILDKSHRWTQKEGTEVRSFSIHHYERVEQ